MEKRREIAIDETGRVVWAANVPNHWHMHPGQELLSQLSSEQAGAVAALLAGANRVISLQTGDHLIFIRVLPQQRESLLHLEMQPLHST